MEKKARKFNCYECKYRGRVAGDAHSCCEYPGNNTGMFDFFAKENLVNEDKLNIQGHPQGIKMGWFLWPVNFDPTWLVNCDGFTQKDNQ